MLLCGFSPFPSEQLWEQRLEDRKQVLHLVLGCRADEGRKGPLTFQQNQRAWCLWGLLCRVWVGTELMAAATTERSGGWPEASVLGSAA